MVLYRWHHKWRIGSQWEVSCLGQRHTAASVKSLTNLGETCLQLLTEESEHMTRTCQIADISSGHACRGDPEIGDGSGRQHLHDVSVDTSNTRGVPHLECNLGQSRLILYHIVPHSRDGTEWITALVACIACVVFTCSFSLSAASAVLSSCRRVRNHCSATMVSLFVCFLEVVVVTSVKGAA